MLLHHNSHVHTFVAGTGARGSFLAEDHGAIGTFSYEIILEATDSTGLKSTTSVNVPVGSDTSPPSAPTGLTATAAWSGQVDLNWTASTDDVAVSGYRVERCQGAGCTNFAEVATPTATTFSDTGLAPSTTYRYRVRAVDASGNLGGYSSIADATTPDAPPTPPAWSGPGRSTRDPAPPPPTPRAAATRGPCRRHLVDPGPVRRRPELQRLDQRGPGRGLGVAGPDHGDDAVGLDPADRQPERLADHHAAPARLLLPQRQQRAGPLRPAGGGTFGTSTTS